MQIRSETGPQLVSKLDFFLKNKFLYWQFYSFHFTTRKSYSKYFQMEDEQKLLL